MLWSRVEMLFISMGKLMWEIGVKIKSSFLDKLIFRYIPVCCR